MSPSALYQHIVPPSKSNFGHVFYYMLLISALTFSACIDHCPDCHECRLKPDAGPCDAAITRYYFDPLSGTCQSFIWGGCEGTVPFESLEACKTCMCKSDDTHQSKADN